MKIKLFLILTIFSIIHAPMPVAILAGSAAHQIHNQKKKEAKKKEAQEKKAQEKKVNN